MKALLLFILTLWAATASAQAVNLLANPGFEEGDQEPAAWAKGRAVPGVTLTWDTEGHKGRRSLKISKSANRYFPIAEWSQAASAPIPNGATHLEVRAWVRARGMTKATLDAQFFNDSGLFSHEWASYIGAKEARDRPANHNWKLYRDSIAIPAGTKRVGVGLQVYGPGTVWFDDVELYFRGPSLPPPPAPELTAEATPATPQPPPDTTGNIVSNWSFEEGEGESPAAWDKGSDVDGVEYLWIRGEAQHGAASLGFRKTAERYFPVAQWTQELPDPPPGTASLQFALQAKAQAVTKAIVDIQYKKPDGGNGHVWALYLGAKERTDSPITHDWQAYNGAVEIPEGATSLRIALQMYGPGIVAFDSLGLRYLSGKPTP